MRGSIADPHRIFPSILRYFGFMMHTVKYEGEEALVAEATGLAEEHFDFVVDALHPSVADPVLSPGEDATGMAQQGLAQLLHLAHA